MSGPKAPTTRRPVTVFRRCVVKAGSVVVVVLLPGAGARLDKDPAGWRGSEGGPEAQYDTINRDAADLMSPHT